MPKATQQSGALIPIDECYIEVVGAGRRITMDNLPDISDTKQATYSDEVSIGRAMPFKNYSHSDNRLISWTCHFLVQKLGDVDKIISDIRLLESCTYPQTKLTGGAPYAPPPICHLKCGRLLGEKHICAILKSYSIKFDTTMPWSPISYLPYKVDMDLSFEVVYNQSNLPGSETIMQLGV